MTTTDARGPEAAAAWLLTAGAVRERAAMICRAGLAGDLEHFAVDETRLDPCADYVIETTRAAYPALDIPYHSRWRHFVVDGEDRWPALARGLDSAERGRVAFDLVVTSVLLDAGAGDAWRYADPKSGNVLSRSEGLAIASLNAFETGLFSAEPARPLRADTAGLRAVTAPRLAEAFQVTGRNPLEGLEGRVDLMNRLGDALALEDDLFDGRIGGLFDRLVETAGAKPLAATRVLDAVLRGLGSIWPGRDELAGRNLGDTWRHPAAVTDNATSGFVPFHKLSQWLTYSLVEPLEDAGVDVIDLDGLTPLAEYRNGGLLVDMGVLVPKHDNVTAAPHAPGDEVIVEWRALTVALIEVLAQRVRTRLDLTADQLPLAKVLQGGTWAAGRRIAVEKRADAGPPIRIVSDGSVF